MSIQLVRVRKDKILACMTCYICNKLLEEATTISLCLHTFCRKCIYDKFSDEECDSCPVCDINLGCNPVDKLRPDHNLQDIRTKVFPIGNRVVEAPEAVPSVSPPVAKRKERSLSSLVVDTPRIPIHSGVTGRRSRAGNRKASAPSRSSSVYEEPLKKDEKDSDEENDEEPSSPETLDKIVLHKKQPSTSTRPSNGQVTGNKQENRKEPWETKVDLWKPLNCLVEAANRTKFSKSSSQGPAHVKTEPSSVPATNMISSKTDVQQNGNKQEARDDKNSMHSSVPESTKRRNRVRAAKKNATASSEYPSSQPQYILEASHQLRPNHPIWFSLVSSEDQEGTPLPQISANFLRIKNGDMPVSSIQKYIAMKLNLPNDSEVDIMCQGQSVLPSLQLKSLLELWLTTAKNPTKRIKTSVGSSGKEYVMVLSYSRKAHVKPAVKIEQRLSVVPLAKTQPPSPEKP